VGKEKKGAKKNKKILLGAKESILKIHLTDKLYFNLDSNNKLLKHLTLLLSNKF